MNTEGNCESEGHLWQRMLGYLSSVKSFTEQYQTTEAETKINIFFFRA